MASLPVQPPVSGRVDTNGRLVAADPPLLALQEQGGAKLGASLVVPQLAALARLASRLGVVITRPVTAASEEEDLDLLVRAEPDPEGVTLWIERWSARSPSRPRWIGGARNDVSADAELLAAAEDLVTDQALRIVSASPGLLRRLGSAMDLEGQPLIRLIRPSEDEAGNLPLLEALLARTDFTGLPGLLRHAEQPVLLDGKPRLQEGSFAGYAISLRGQQPLPTSKFPDLPPLDSLLREPLAAIIDQAEEIAARRQGPLKTDYAGYGTDIATAARHLLGLLAALGDGRSSEVSDGSSGELLDLAELVLDAAGLVQADAAVRRVTLDVGGEGRLPARGQPRAITQILVNLIGNAVRFSPEGGTVTITLERDGVAAVTVADEGPGVAVDDRHRIFEPFEQGSDTRGGTAGLGLAISRRLARDMRGEVELLDLPTQGAAFRLTLPAA